MRKGVRPAHNLQILRWSKEHNIRVSWNLITGIPGASAEMYERMVALFPLLFLLSLYFQTGLHYSALRAGSVICPEAAGVKFRTNSVK